MEVLTIAGGANRRAELAISGEENLGELGGESLIQTIVSLTELPEPLVQQEMQDIIEASGHRTESLTLEQLRVAMLSYLESIQADFGGDDNDLTGNDASLTKAPVILE